jgi:septal ring-binding cell division protein DamX
MIRAENGPVIKVVYFHKGSIAFASSNEKCDRLTEVLKQAGKLTPEQVQDAQSRLKPNVSLGKTLVELGYISAKDLLWGARAQVDGILHHLLFWNQGKFQIQEGNLPREIIHLNLPVPNVIFEGIMKTQNRDWILQHIGSPEAIYAISTDFNEQAQQLKLPVSSISTQLNGRRSLHEIAQSSGIDSFELCKAVVALEYLDLARPIQDEPLQMQLNTTEAGEQPTAVADHPVPTEMEQPQQQPVPLTPQPEAQELQAPSKPPENHFQEKETVAVPQAAMPESESMNETNEPRQEESIDEPGPLAAVPVALQSPATEPVEEIHEIQEEALLSTSAAESASSHWKLWVAILLAAAALGGAAFYHFSREKDPGAVKAATLPHEELGEESAPYTEPAPIVEQAAVSTEPAESLDPSPLLLLQSGRISDAAESWSGELAAHRKDYSIQIVIACQEKTVLDTFKLLNHSDEFILLPLVFRGQNCYRVLFGRYSTRAAALDAVEALPDVFLRQASPATVVALSKVLP